MVDLYGGAEDLKNGIIRCVGDPMKRFDEDGLRILRALRFASRYGFSIDKETSELFTDRNSCFHLFLRNG